MVISLGQRYAKISVRRRFSEFVREKCEKEGQLRCLLINNRDQNPELQFLGGSYPTPNYPSEISVDYPSRGFALNFM